MKYICRYIQLLLTLSWGALHGQNVDFSADNIEGCAPHVVQFYNLSTGFENPTYYWDLGNGTTSALEHPQALYLDDGSYTVSLTVTENANTYEEVKENYIIVFLKPEIEFQASDTTGCMPLNVSFLNQCSPGTGNIQQYIWYFGDGDSSNLENPYHTYPNNGNFNVTLRAIDENGCSKQITKSSYIEVYELPHVDFSANDSITCGNFLVVNFIDQCNANIANYYWNLGNGNTSNQANPTGIYNSQGQYDIALEATDDKGCINTKEKESFINIVNNHADFQIPKDTACVGEEIILQNLSSEMSDFSWDFGNGDTSDQAEPTVIYEQPGDYNILLVASFLDNCTDSIVKTIHIEEIIADFSTNKNYICQFPDTLQYINNSINAETYEWRFYNNTYSSFPSPVVVYDSNSNVTIGIDTYLTDTLIVTSINGCSDTSIHDDLVHINIPNITFDYTLPSKGCIPVNIGVDNNSEYNSGIDSIVKYIWDFSNGDVSYLPEPEYQYNEPGEYLINLSAITELGCENSFSRTAMAGTQQTASFILESSDSTCASIPVVLKDLSTDSNLINEWLWEFSDSTKSQSRNPTVFLTDTGYIDVTLYAIYNGCFSDPETKENLFYLNAPIGMFYPFLSCESPYKRAFLGSLIGVDDFLWNFGDNTYDSTSVFPIHFYSDRGDYNVKFNSVNYSTGCNYEYSGMVFIRDIEPVIIIDKQAICLGDTITLDASYSNDVEPIPYNGTHARYKWVLGDSTIILTNKDTIEYVYSQPGNYKIKLIVSDLNLCQDTADVLIKVSKPIANFYTSDSVGCKPFSVVFGDSSLVDTTYQPRWYFGDGITSNENNPIHQYSSNGLFDVSLTVEDAIGCRDSVTKQNFIEVSKPHVSFHAQDSTLCLGNNAIFENNSGGSDLEFLWHFGDGDTSSIKNPVHVYNSSGVYGIELYAIDKNGCDSNLIKENYIELQDLPNANFTCSDDYFDCYPALVNFFDNSTSDNIVNWEWNFNDSTGISNQQNPVHFFTIPGVFDINFGVTTNFGCFDDTTMEAYIQVNGPYANIVAHDSACFGVPMHFSLSNSINIQSLYWEMGDGTIYNDVDSITHTYQQPGYVYPTVYLFADSVNTCDKIFTDTVFIEEINPNFKIPSYGLCRDTIILFSNLSSTYDYNKWILDGQFIDDDVHLVHSFSAPGEHSLKLLVTTTLGCIDSITKSFTINDLPSVKIIHDTSICKYDTIQLWSTGGSSYSWNNSSYLNDNKLKNPLAFPGNSTKFIVTVVDSNGCINNNSVQISVLPLPKYTISNDTTLVIGETAHLIIETNEADSFFWSPNLWINSITEPSVQVKPEEDIIYNVVINGLNGCSSMDTININIDKSYSVVLPDYFTPNQNGKNDIIYVEGWGIKKLIFFEIYNEWGQKVFVSNDKDTGWNGKINGVDAEPGTYAYKVKVLLYNGQTIERKGSFSLIR